MSNFIKMMAVLEKDQFEISANCQWLSMYPNSSSKFQRWLHICCTSASVDSVGHALWRPREQISIGISHGLLLNLCGAPRCAVGLGYEDGLRSIHWATLSRDADGHQWWEGLDIRGRSGALCIPAYSAYHCFWTGTGRCYILISMCAHMCE